MKIGIIGAGKVGTTLCIVLKRAGYEVAVSSKHAKSAERASFLSGATPVSKKEVCKSDVVFLTVPDSAIVSVAKNISRLLSKEQIVIHTSGALSSKEISFLPAYTCSLHPLKSFADPVLAADSMKGTLFTFEGAAEAEPVIKKIVLKIGGKFLEIRSEDKPLYHLAAVIAANYTVSLFDISEKILENIGFPETDANSAVLNLIGGVLKNIESKGATNALTGPIERGDAKTVEKHLKAIKDPLLKRIYIFLGFATLNIAKEKGLSKEKIEKIRKVLNEQNNCS